MKRYNPSEIEPKWQKIWQQNDTYKVDVHDQTKPKFYGFAMLPYPSGSGLHTGHVRTYTLADVTVRAKRQQGFNAYNPIGWDAFGLPAENHAIKTGTPPKETTDKAIARFREQLQRVGMSHDWSKEVNTSDPEYYKWTQWIFTKLFEHGLAYQKESLQWWCDIDKTVLANEQVVGGKCWRHDGPNDPLVGKKALKQWFFKITDYADELLEGTDDLEWPDFIKTMQKNWIGRSRGAEVDFVLEDSDKKITVFTTRPDTIFGATFIVLAPEHELVSTITTGEQQKEVQAYVRAAQAKSDVERQETDREKTGVFTGAYATNPATNQRVPVWVADYVLATYGTGAIMAVPAHDERDFAFAEKFTLPIKQVVMPCDDDSFNPPKEGYGEVTRDTVVVHLQNKSTGKFALLNWHGSLEGITTAIMGGIEPGQTAKQAARAEIIEEAALKNVKIVKKSRWVTGSRYCASHKGENRKAIATVLFAEVDDLSSQGTIAESEKKLHTLIWVDKSDVVKKLTPAHQKMLWEQLWLDTSLPGEGELINSGKYNGLNASAARETITEDLVKEGKARWSTNYKIRDWLISRQRYWGAPIPIVHCSHCRETIEQHAQEINFYNDDIWQQIVNGHKTVESRADNPEEPGRRFANIREGDYLKFVNKNTGAQYWAKVQKATRYATFEELFADKTALKAIFGSRPIPNTVAALEASYAKLAQGYGEKIKKNGLVTWQFTSVVPGVTVVPESQLPVTLPELTTFTPAGEGKSPLARVDNWVNTVCPNCGKPAQRETDTMDGYACSSWYFLRYLDPHNQKQAWDQTVIKNWMPIDFYNGADHAVSHLLYARFWTHFFYKLGLVAHPEPVKRLVYNAYILAHDGTKMSKSKGNVVDPLEIVESGYGADALRVYEMFIAPYDMEAPWDDKGVPGTYRFLRRTWDITQKFVTEGAHGTAQNKIVLALTHKTIKKVTKDIEQVKFNTAIAAMMKMVNELFKLDLQKTQKQDLQFALESLIQLLAPFAPHMAEELWQALGHEDSVHIDHWPAWDESYLIGEKQVIVIQVNGKVRANIELPLDAAQSDIEKIALTHKQVQKFVNGVPKRIVHVPGRLVNFVV